jgi:hypothetical protein
MELPLWSHQAIWASPKAEKGRSAPAAAVSPTARTYSSRSDTPLWLLSPVGTWFTSRTRRMSVPLLPT